jgi:hypothetical protein
VTTMMEIVPGHRHQWWCEAFDGGPETCHPLWIAYERRRVAGQLAHEPPLDVREGPSCLRCKGTGEMQMDTPPDPARPECFTVVCMGGTDGRERRPDCPGNGGGRMSPAVAIAWALRNP